MRRSRPSTLSGVCGLYQMWFPSDEPVHTAGLDLSSLEDVDMCKWILTIEACLWLHVSRYCRLSNLEQQMINLMRYEKLADV